MAHAYRITVERLQPDVANDAPASSLTFEATNHDEVLGLVERVRASGILPEGESAAFLVGLKLFGEVMLKHRAEPLFAPIVPHFAAFMKRLKADVSAAAQARG